VRFVDCSFPSVPSEAPHIQLERWESMQDSEWQVRWAPSWSVQVAVEGSHYLSFSLMLRLYDFRVRPRPAHADIHGCVRVRHGAASNTPVPCTTALPLDLGWHRL